MLYYIFTIIIIYIRYIIHYTTLYYIITIIMLYIIIYIIYYVILDIGVCFCGAPVIGADLKTMCEKYSSVKEEVIFTLHKENF